MKIKYKRSSNKIHTVAVAVHILVMALIVLGIRGVEYFCLNLDESVADYYSEFIFPKVSYIANTLSNALLFSITENVVVVGIIAGVILLVILVVLLIKGLLLGMRRETWRRIRIGIIKALVLVLLFTIAFELMHGINYRRATAAKRLNLDTYVEFKDYNEALNWAYSGMVAARNELGEDYNGVAHMQTSFDEAVLDANLLLDVISDNFDLGLSPNFVRAKAVSLSGIWSYTDITGAYDMFLGEANVNTDYLDVLYMPITICHEICHARGYARESDCNTIAVIACTYSYRADFRYAGYYYIFTHLYQETVNYGEAVKMRVNDYLHEAAFAGVRRDIIARNDYWDSLEDGFIPDLISRFSEEANNAFLESNGQEGGTDTYNVHPDLYVSFYCTYLRGEYA